MSHNSRGLAVVLTVCLALAASGIVRAQEAPTTAPAPNRAAVLATMKRATEFMVNKVGYKGGYVWSYTADMSRRWGEMEAFPTMMWLQGSGSNAMGHALLDIYHATKDEYYYQAAQQVADALIKVQHPSGGWNYIADLSGEESLKKWYDTIGKNGWRLEEFQHYYGNATFDDSTTTDTAKFMLRIYFEKKDPKYKASLDKAIQFVLDSQYPVGGWPQRFPLMTGFSKGGQPDYTSFITYNDNVATGNIDFLVLCYRALGDKRLLDPIQRGMNCFVVTQQPAPQAGWGLQHDPKDLTPASARTYEPRGFATHSTQSNIDDMIKFYYWTGDKKFLARLPEAFDWLDSVKLPENMPGARGSHPTFVEIGTNKPLFIHRTGSNVINGRYFADYDPQNTVGHYSSFRGVNTEGLREQYKQALATPADQVTKDSPLRADAPPIDLAREFAPRGFGGGGGGRGGRGAGRGGRGGGPGGGGGGFGGGGFGGTPEQRAAQLVASLNAEGYWPGRIGTQSHPYKGDGPKEIAPGNFVSSQVGDDYDTSPYGGGGRGGQGGAQAGTPGISTQSFIGNMRALITYLDTAKP